MTPITRRAAVLALGALAMTAAAAPSALPAKAAPSLCPGQVFAPVFSAFGDDDLYTLVPGGDFEAPSAWSGGQRVEGGEPRLGGPDAWELELAAGPAGLATATSGDVCVTRDYRWLRMFATSPSADARLRVRVAYPGGERTEAVLRGGAASPLTPRIDLDSRRIAHPRATGTSTIRVEITALRGVWQVDDVYVDPRMR
ncbi:MAG TPA: hypothetical protein VNT51_08640 [Miltoncostaeaceae bacterium]|nr:hypothetical protein [Miltoncostaeaceae bacterium]